MILVYSPSLPLLSLSLPYTILLLFSPLLLSPPSSLPLPSSLLPSLSLPILPSSPHFSPPLFPDRSTQRLGYSQHPEIYKHNQTRRVKGFYSTPLSLSCVCVHAGMCACKFSNVKMSKVCQGRTLPMKKHICAFE